MTIPDWHKDAACRDSPRALFFSPDGERCVEKAAREAHAKAICGACPVKPECHEHASTYPERYGTWGGMTEAERQAAARRERRRAHTALRRLEATA